MLCCVSAHVKPRRREFCTWLARTLSGGDDGDVNGLGERLRQARIRAGLSQEQAAQRIGCDRSSLSRWEKGEVPPAADRLLQLAELYGVSPNELTGWTPAESVPAPAPSDGVSVWPDLRRALRDPDVVLRYGGRELSEQDKEKLVAIIDNALSFKEPEPGEETEWDAVHFHLEGGEELTPEERAAAMEIIRDEWHRFMEWRRRHPGENPPVPRD